MQAELLRPHWPVDSLDWYCSVTVQSSFSSTKSVICPVIHHFSNPTTWKHVGPMPKATSDHDFPVDDVSEVWVCMLQIPTGWSGQKNWIIAFFLGTHPITQKAALEWMRIDACG